VNINDRFVPAAKVLVVVATVALSLGILRSQVSARMQEDLPGGASIELNSLVSQEVAFSTATKPNPFNLDSLNTDHNTLNFVSSRAESSFTLSLGPDQAAALGFDDIRLFGHGRFYADTAPFFDKNLNYVNMFTPDLKYPGNGWGAQTTSSSEYESDLVEGYLDLHRGPLWLRVGKQAIEYGGGLLTRATNDINSLDYRRNLFFDNLLTEWQDQLIAQWTAKVNYSLDLPMEGFSNSSVTAWISPDVQPDIFPAAGTWYNVFPSFVKLDDSDNIASARRKLAWGSSIQTNYEGLDMTALYYSTPEHQGQFYAKECSAPYTTITVASTFSGPGCIAGTPFIYNPKAGAPFFANTLTFKQLIPYFINGTLPPANPAVAVAAKETRLSLPAAEKAFIREFPGLDFVNCFGCQADNNLLAIGLNNPDMQLNVGRHFPRENVFAGLLSYSVNSVEDYPGSFLINGDQLRLDVDYKPNFAYTDAIASPNGIRQGNLDIVAEVEHWARFTPRLQSTYLVFEYWYSSASDFFEHNLSAEGLGGGWHLLAFAFQQPFFNSRLTYTGIFVLDMVNFGVGAPGWLHESVLAYKPTSNLQFQFTYNYGSGNATDAFGPISTMDDAILGVTYRF
jgi:uncharacterized protein DUF1302